MATEHNHHKNIQKNLKVAFLLNLSFAIAETIGGLYTNSMAILSDALHDLGDSLSLAAAWQLERLSERDGDSQYSYGYKRFSLLSALISGIVLLLGSIFIISEAIQRTIKPQTSDARGMLIFALVGMAVNGYAAMRTKQGGNLNSRMISWHLMEDLLGWVAVFLMSIILLFWEIQILDPLLSLAISIFVVFNVLKNLRSTLRLFLQGVPERTDIKTIEAEIRKLNKVKDMHHTHIWSLDGEQHVLTTHVVLYQDAKKEEIRIIKNKIRDLAADYGLAHTTVEFEYLEEDCSMSNSDSGVIV